jgi:hypothetical protein
LTIAPLVPRKILFGRLHQHDRADDVDVQAVQPLGPGRGGAVVQVGTGDVDQKVDPAETRLGGRHQRRGLGIVAQVARRKGRALGQAFGFHDVGHHHAGARRHEGIDHRPPDLGRPAGHDGHLSGQSAHSLASLSAAPKSDRSAGRRYPAGAAPIRKTKKT